MSRISESAVGSRRESPSTTRRQGPPCGCQCGCGDSDAAPAVNEGSTAACPELDSENSTVFASGTRRPAAQSARPRVFIDVLAGPPCSWPSWEASATSANRPGTGAARRGGYQLVRAKLMPLTLQSVSGATATVLASSLGAQQEKHPPFSVGCSACMRACTLPRLCAAVSETGCAVPSTR